MIIHDISQIIPETIRVARSNRAERLAKQRLDEAIQRGEKRKLEDFVIDIEQIQDTDVVFRIMTWSHVPIQPDSITKKPKKSQVEPEDDESIYIEYDNEEIIETQGKFMKCNFPPFQHFKIDSKGNIFCVGKSHWKGNLSEGFWSRDHGNMTRTLADMFIKLCERYATRSNWRGYTYNDEMRSQALLQLSQIGLQFDESKSQNPFAYYTAAITNSFTRVLNIEKRNQNLRDDILEMNNFAPSYTRQGMLSGGHIADDHD